MTESWKQWEGQLIDQAFPLHEYLGGDEGRAVFLTEYGEPAPQKAAIKVILGNPENTESQLHRWEVAANLSHPHLVRIFTMGRAQLGGVPLIYLVTEYADENLADVIANRPLTAEEARDMLDPTLSALAYTHSQGFAHGHLKPSNIMGVSGSLRISSDGLSQIGACGPTNPDAYTPPELYGNSPAGDVWSFGMTLVEALAQRLPVWGTAKQQEPAVPATLPDPFLEIARHCLRLDPGDRWPVAHITARLRTMPPVRERRNTEKTRAASRTWIYGSAALLCLVVAGIAIAPRLLVLRSSNSPQISQALSIQPEQRGVQPQPEQNATASRAAPSAAPGPLLQRGEPKNLTSAAGSVSDEVVQRVLPEVSSSAMQTIRGRVKVRVRLHVDPSGSVTGAELDSPGPSKYFAQLALEAARRWEFTPAKAGQRAVPSEWMLQFEFLRTNTRAVAFRVAP